MLGVAELHVSFFFFLLSSLSYPSNPIPREADVIVLTRSDGVVFFFPLGEVMFLDVSRSLPHSIASSLTPSP